MAVGGERKIFFLRSQRCGRQPLGKRLSDEGLPRPVSGKQGARKRCRKRSDVIVKKRHATFDRVGHLLAVSEKIQLVRRQIVNRRHEPIHIHLGHGA